MGTLHKAKSAAQRRAARQVKGAERMERILVVDANEESNRSLCEQLRESGFNVLGAVSQEAAASHLAQRSFDVVLLDLDAIKERLEGLLDLIHSRQPGICIIAMASEPKVETVISALRGGAFDFIVKPYDLAQILQRITKGLESRKLFSELKSLADKLAAANRHLQREKEQLERENKDLLVIGEVARAITSTLNLDEILRVILQGIQKMVVFDRLVLSLINWERKVEEAKIATGVDEESYQEFLSQMRFSIEDFESNPSLYAILVEKKPILIDPENDPRYASTVFARLYCGKLVKVPIVVKDRVIGTITADNFRTRRPIDARDIKVLSLFAEYAGISLENGRLYYEVIQSQEKLVKSERLATIGQIAISLNHEINNPLCSIALNVAALRRALGDADARVLGALKSIEENVNRISIITRKLADMKEFEVVEYLPDKLMIDLNR